MQDQPDLSSAQGVVAFSITESDNALRKECSGCARLQFFMVYSFSESITLVISPLAATMADDDSDKDNGPVGRQSLYFAAKYCTTT